MPAIANFLMRTSIKRLTEDERWRPGNQLTVWTDGLLYQDVISTRRFDGRIMKSMPPDQGRVCLRLVVRLREKPWSVQEWLAGGRILTVVQTPRLQTHPPHTRPHTRAETRTPEISHPQHA